jgi:DNA mismatch repair protein MutS
MSETTDTLTPMMRQYRQIRASLPDGVILFFRLGDFYEMFFDDAKTAAPILDVALTRRNGVPMCGVPHHAVDSYMARLLRAGRKVAICDQMEDPADAKGIVRRDVTRIVTPGTATESAMLESNRHTFLAAVHCVGGIWGLALLDLSTGAFECEEHATVERLREALRRAVPRECVAAASVLEKDGLRAVLVETTAAPVSACDDWTFEYETARDTLVRHFHVHSLDGFGCEGRAAAVGAAGAALHYVREELRRPVAHIRSMRLRGDGTFMQLDESTCVNLDLAPRRGREAAQTLLGVLDATRTPMGGRLLRDWLLQPLTDLLAIRRRHDGIEGFVENRGMMRDLIELLGEVRDLERLIARLSGGGGNARDLVAVARSLNCLPSLKTLLEDHPAPVACSLREAFAPMPDLVRRIDEAIVDEPPAVVKEGGMIRKGHHAELDSLRAAATEGREWLAQYQVAEQERAGIKSLKVRHNRVFGYYIEVSKGQLANVPANYQRKQTVATGERYVTPELKDYETRIVGAQDKAMALEYELFCAVREEVTKETVRIQAIAQAVAQLDVLAAFADRALAMRYVRPEMNDSDTIRIRAGRHPVVEGIAGSERFVPNDALLDNRRNQLLIITGPNMAGKSTYIRQVALLVIMAQAGSYVPAEEAEIGIVDRVFTRVGASDDLARGRSTFMVEMQETANILNNATARSLIVLDEIGRGTSTFDGISIAWAVAEYLHSKESVKAKTLFATHYHELTDLAMTMPGVKNYNVLVRDQGEGIVFLRRIVPGGADKSYGIQVARLAGMPGEVIERAREILANLEEGEISESGQPKLAKRRNRKVRDLPGQMDLFG